MTKLYPTGSRLKGAAYRCLACAILSGFVPGVLGEDTSNLERPIRHETPLAPPSGPQAVVVYPSGLENGRGCAERIRDAIRGQSGDTLDLVSDLEVTDPDSRLVRAEYMDRPLLLLGNAVDNRAIYAVATKFLALSNKKWPGGDRYCNRGILEPFRAGVNAILLEASTEEGLDAATEAFLERLSTISDRAMTVPRFRDQGAAGEEWLPEPFEIAGLDLTQSVEEIKDQLVDRYGASVAVVPGGLYFYDAWAWLEGAGDEAAKYAAAVLLLQHERGDPPERIREGHYNFDRTIKAWRICFTAGVVSDELMHRVERAMVQSAAYPADGYADGLKEDDGLRASVEANRHWLATLANFICNTDYVLNHCSMEDKVRRLVEGYHQSYLAASRRFVDSFRSNNTSNALGDCAVMMMNLMALTGQLDYVHGGTLARAAEMYLATCNNLGTYIGEGPYLGSLSLEEVLPGKSIIASTAFYSRDPGMQWLYRNLKGASYCQTSHQNPVYDDETSQAYPEKYVGVIALPFDPRIYRAYTELSYLPEMWRESTVLPLGVSRDRLIDRAFFRDGFTEDDAFLSMVGTQRTSHDLHQANAIVQYTDLGKILLFTHSQRADSWARNVVSASNGEPCESSPASRRAGLINTPRVAAISTVNPRNGNTQWTRTIFHRRNHWFVTIDSLEALMDDDFTFTCRWRALHPADLVDGVWRSRAGDGVEFRLQSADAILQESRQVAADGAAAPYVLSQYQDRSLLKGESVIYRNLFYAAGPTRPDVCEVRPAGETCVLVRGRGEAWDETTLLGVTRTPAEWDDLVIDADVFFVDAEEIAAVNCRRVHFQGNDLFVSPDGEDIVLPVDLPALEIWLETRFHDLPPAQPEALDRDQDVDLEELWSFSDYTYPRIELRPASIAASRSSVFKPVSLLTDPTRSVRLQTVRHGAAWPGEADDLEITLDMGQTVNLSHVRLLGPIADNYVQRYYYQEGDLSFTVEYSDDNFVNDRRIDAAPNVDFEDYTFSNAQYIYSGRVPAFVLRADQTARYIRIKPTTDQSYLAFQKILVYGQEPAPRLPVELRSANLDEGASDELVIKTSASEIVALDRTGQRLWNQQLPDPITAWDCVDLEQDGRKDVLAYTTGDACYALSSDGFLRWRADVWGQYVRNNPDTWDRSWCPYTVACLTAWRPRADGRKEMIGFGHTAITTIAPDGEITHRAATPSEKAVLADAAVLGREVLVTVGQRFLLREAEGDELTASVAMKGALSGNGQLPVFAFVASVTNAECVGFFAINGSSLYWAPAASVNAGWGKATDVPITSCAFMDVNEDTCPEAVVGFADGYLRAYDLRTGRVLRKSSVGSEVLAIAGWEGKHMIAVASRSAVSILNQELRIIAQLPMQVTALAALRGEDNLLCVADRTGAVRCYAIHPIDRRSKPSVSSGHEQAKKADQPKP